VIEVKTSDEIQIWSAFEEQEDIPLPTVPIAQENPIRYPHPLERLAGWFLSGAPALLLSLLFFSLFLITEVSVWQVAHAVLLSGALTWLVLPFTGQRPSATPARLILTALSGLALFTLLASPTQYFLVPEGYKDGFTIERAREFQETVERLTTWKAVAPSLLFLGLVCFFSKWLSQRYFWLETETERPKARLWLSLAIIVLPLLFLLLYPLYLAGSVRKLDWIESARSHDPFQEAARQFSDEGGCHLKNEYLRRFAFQQPEPARNALKALTEEQFRHLLGELSSEIQDREFRPTSEDAYLLTVVSERAALKGAPTEESAYYALALWKLANGTRNGLPGLSRVEELFESVLVPYLSELSLQETQAWKAKLLPLSTFNVTLADLDSVVLEQVERPMGLYRTEKPLTLLGFQVGDRSVSEMYSALRDNTILLDYTKRREQVKLTKQSLHQAVLRSDGLPLVDMDINSFYGFLGYKLNPAVLERNLGLAQSVLLLREDKLKSGSYPQKAPDTLPTGYVYRSEGNHAILRREVERIEQPTRDWMLR